MIARQDMMGLCQGQPRLVFAVIARNAGIVRSRASIAPDTEKRQTPMLGNVGRLILSALKRSKKRDMRGNATNVSLSTRRGERPIRSTSVSVMPSASHSQIGARRTRRDSDGIANATARKSSPISNFLMRYVAARYVLSRARYVGARQPRGITTTTPSRWTFAGSAGRITALITASGKSAHYCRSYL